jgi:hypothetical protein
MDLSNPTNAIRTIKPMVWVVLAIVVIAIGVGMYFLIFKKGNDGDLLKKNWSVQEILAPSTTVDTNAWETYRNDELGFSAKHPKGWRINESNTPKEVLRHIITFYDSEENGFLRVHFYSNPDKLLPEAWARKKSPKTFEKNAEGQTLGNFDIYTLGGLEGFAITPKNPTPVAGGSVTFYANFKDNMIEVYFSANNSRRETNSEQENAMLAVFNSLTFQK